MQPRSPRVVELLNDALRFELTVVNAYFLHARMLDNWGLRRLGKVFYDLSIGEMRDADALIERILMYDGRPKVQPLDPLLIGEDVEQILRLALQSEIAAVARFNDAAAACRELGDHRNGKIFEDLALDEESHADWFESQLDAIARAGLENYIAAQVEPGTGP